MTNAFTILGAEPSDNAERLQELLEEKELLLDDMGEVQMAYADLTNPKKRVQHEIAYFSDEALSEFNKLVSHSFHEKPTIGKIANILVELGWWFEADNTELFDSINDARENGGYPLLDDESIIFFVLENLKQDCISSTNTYLGGLTEKSLVGIFNQIVKVEDYESFFIDELLAYYELTISESLQEKENKCNAIFNEIERMCNTFNNGGSLSYNLSSKVAEFKTALKEWDNYAQPLQVNAQMRGGQHEGSGRLVHDIRNRIVELCNRSQDKLKRSLDSFQKTSIQAQLGVGSRYAVISARDALEKQLNDSISFTQSLMILTDILGQVFAELAITTEQLKDDKKQLSSLKNTLIELRNQIPGAQQRASYIPSPTASNYSSTHTASSQSTSSHTSSVNGYRVLLGVIAAICGILMIVGFSIGNVAMGIAFIILGLAFAIGCGAFYAIKGNKKGLIAIVLVPIILILAVVVPVATSSSSESGRTVTITSSNFEDYFTVSVSGSRSGNSVTANYSISPKKSTYATNSDSTNITVQFRITIKPSTNSSASQSKVVNVTLTKTAKYKKSGSVTVTFNSNYSKALFSYSTSIISCSGKIEK